jgi:hypothetical protein
MAGAGIQSFAKFRSKMLVITTTGITSWQTALKWTADCAQKSSLWQSALKFILLSEAIRATVILILAIRVLNAADCHNPWRTFERGTWQEAEFQLPPFYASAV